MRSFTSHAVWALAVLAGLSTANAAVVSDSSQCLAEICGELTYNADTSLTARSMPGKPCPSATPTLSHRDLTNAERLGRGLPLKPPVRRTRGHAARAQISPVPQSLEPEEENQSSTPPDDLETVEPDVYEGIIEVRKTDGTSLGYVSATQRATGIFKYSTIDTALKVSIPLEAGTTSGTGLAITMLNSDGPLFGLVQGRDSTTVDIEPGSFNYLYFNGIELPGSQPGSVPMTLPNGYSSTSATQLSRAAESHIWNLDLTTGDLFPQWINSDGSSPTTEMWLQGGYMYAGGDPFAFVSKYPSPIIPFTLHFVINN